MSRLPLPWLIAWRYLRGERSRMLSTTALAAWAATALGVLAMVIAMALMTGYTEELQRKLIGLQGEIVATPLVADAFESSAESLARAAEIDGVVRVGRVVYGQGALRSAALPEGMSVILRGVETGDPRVPDPRLLLPGDDGLPSVVLGSELARRLAVVPDEILRLVLLDAGGPRPRFRYRSVRFAGTFTSGFAAFDEAWMVIDREALVEARGASRGDTVEFQLDDPRRTDEVASRIEQELGEAWMVERWHRRHRDLFRALKLQEALLFLVLGLIVLVSTFNVASTLIILVRERRRDLGVLAALGLGPRRLWWIFTAYGLLLGAAGIATGVALGSAVAWTITEFELVRFPPEVAEVYFIDSVPFLVEIGDLALIVGFSLAVTLAACALPARRGARLNPSAALRDE